TIFLLLTPIYWVTAIFLLVLDLLLFINSTIIMIIIMYGSLLILPSIPFKTGRPKVLVFEIIFVSILLLLFSIAILNLFYLIWDIVLSIFMAYIVAEDFDGLTPIFKSEIGVKRWNEGEEKFKFLFGEYKLQPYGQIILEKEKCIGCKWCIEVCPRNLYLFIYDDKKVELTTPEKCINCNACVKRCLGKCLKIV
ncbi:MAG: ferredoxin family protein, partial [Candidatus Thorarchaeota archaeon]